MTSYMKDCKQLHPNFFPEHPFYPKVDVHFHISNSQVLQAHNGLKYVPASQTSPLAGTAAAWMLKLKAMVSAEV